MVSRPTRDRVIEYEEFTGHLVAMHTVAIRSRVSGYLDKVYFKDGAKVNEGDLLFLIDDRSFKATAANAEALVAQANSRLANLLSQEKRANALATRQALAAEEAERLGFERAEAEAALASAKAQRDLAELDVSYSQIKAPVSGVINNRQVDPGNLVKADDTILATIVSQDPIYAYFDINERTVLRLRRLISEGRLAEAHHGVEVQISLADEDDFKHRGTIDFLDNQLDPNTGTLRVRAVIPNKNGLLSPGLFVRLRFPVSPEHEALLVQEEALGTDQGQRFLYVLNEENEVAYRRVKIGILDNGRRVIEDGLKPEERIIVKGLQRVRPGDKVAPKEIAIAADDKKAHDTPVTLVSEPATASQATGLSQQPTSQRN